jgi:4'-phosphopantetheinyl transferase EntD
MNNIEAQRVVAQALVYGLTGKTVRHSRTGRPFVRGATDISISHKDSHVVAAAVRPPYRIGIDIERLVASLDAELFFGSFITHAEIPCLTNYCREKELRRSSGVAVFWSIKESFFKCLDYDLKPGKINISDITEEGAVHLTFSGEIKDAMRRKRLEFRSTGISLGNGYVLSRTLMKKVARQYKNGRSR